MVGGKLTLSTNSRQQKKPSDISTLYYRAGTESERPSMLIGYPVLSELHQLFLTLKPYPE